MSKSPWKKLEINMGRSQADLSRAARSRASPLLEKHVATTFLVLDPVNGDLITFTRASTVLPRRRRGKQVHVGTLHRWRSRGLKGISLPALRVGGVWMTSAAALNWFFQRLSEPNPPNGDVMPSASAPDQGLASAGW
jgi:hypothetical protein